MFRSKTLLLLLFTANIFILYTLALETEIYHFLRGQRTKFWHRFPISLFRRNGAILAFIESQCDKYKPIFHFPLSSGWFFTDS